MQELVEQLVGYLRGVWHRRWIGLAVAWMTAIIGALIVFRLPDKYEASARVYVDTQSLLRPLMAGMAVSPDAGQQVSILSRILLSRPNVEKIIRKSDLDTSAGTTAEALIDETAGSLKISRAGGDNLYTISFRYSEGRKARDVVQAALSTFIEQSLGETRLGTDSARKFIDEQIRDYERRLQEGENRLQAFRLKYMALLGTSGRDYVSHMGALGEQIKDTRVELRVAEQTRDSIKRQLAEQTSGGVAPSPGAAATGAVPELDGRIEALKRQLDELLRRYTEQHPDVVGNRRLLTQLEEERTRELEARKKAAAGRPNAELSGDPIAQQLKVALNESEANITTVRARLSEYESRINQLRAAAEALPRIDSELTQLNRDYEIQKRQYESLVSRRETAMLTGKLEDAGVAEFRIIDPPRVTPNPVAPNRLLMLGGLLAASLGAGLAASFLMSQVRPTFHDGRLLRQVVERPLLGMVSMVPSQGFRQQRRRAALLFAGGVCALLASYSVTLVVTYLTTRGF